MVFIYWDHYLMTVERKKKTPFGGHKGPYGGNQITNKGGKLRDTHPYISG